MRYKIIDIREDDEGYLWFLAEDYHNGEDWWLHLSDEYAFDYKQNHIPVRDDVATKRYELREMRSEE